MWFSRKRVEVAKIEETATALALAARKPEKPPRSATGVAAATGSASAPKQITTKRRGDAAETAARQYLVSQGLALVENNYRTPGRGGGEIDLVMRARDGTLVFVEVRQRSSESHGGAGASISPVKQRRIIFAAQHYLMRFGSPPACRFDVVLVQGASPGAAQKLEWLKAAFDASV